MDKLTIRKEIAVLINSIKEHSDNIGDKDHVPQLELELILHKIEKLYQKTIVFNHINSLSDTIGSSQPITSGKKEEEKKIILEIPKQEIKPEPVKFTETDATPVDLFGSVLPPIVEKPKQEKKSEKKEEKPVANKIQKPAVSDITKAIGINDKFRFANELFQGNVQEYSIAIQQLNSAESIESAMDYFGNLQQLYDWDLESETVKYLLDLVDRRYS